MDRFGTVGKTNDPLAEQSAASHHVLVVTIGDAASSTGCHEVTFASCQLAWIGPFRRLTQNVVALMK
jgi:hypothetical protein